MAEPCQGLRGCAQLATPEVQVRKTVQSFYNAFNSHNFERVPDFTTEDWAHINPLGGWTRGRDNVLKELREVHSTFLKGVTDKPQEMEVRFATVNIAIVTVSSRSSPYTTPDGVRPKIRSRSGRSWWSNAANAG